MPSLITDIIITKIKGANAASGAVGLIEGKE